MSKCASGLDVTINKGKGKIHLHSAAFAHTAFSSAVVTDKAAG